MRYYNENSYQSDDDDDQDSVISDMVVDELNLDSLEEPKIKKKRIREKLDHLTHEEKLMRRKIKNRISAQSARDRKKSKMQTLEKKIEVLSQDRHKILKENAVLKRQNEQIIQENSELKKRLVEIESRLTAISTQQQPQPQNQQQQQQQVSSSVPLQNLRMSNQVNIESNKLKSDFKTTSIQTAELIKVFQPQILDVEMNLDRKAFNSKVNKRAHSTVQKQELIILIRQLISLFMIMRTNVKTYSTGSKTATKISLQQTLKKLRLILTKQQMKVLLTNVISRQVKMDCSKLELFNRRTSTSLKVPGSYQKRI